MPNIGTWWLPESHCNFWVCSLLFFKNRILDLFPALPHPKQNDFFRKHSLLKASLLSYFQVPTSLYWSNIVLYVCSCELKYIYKKEE